jgi:hypothetical protein
VPHYTRPRRASPGAQERDANRWRPMTTINGMTVSSLRDRGGDGDSGGGGPEREVALRPRPSVKSQNLVTSHNLEASRDVPASQRTHVAMGSFALEIACPCTRSLVTPWGCRRICVREVLPLAGGRGDVIAQPAYCRVVAALLHGWDAPVRQLIVLPPYATSHARTQPSLLSLQRPSLDIRPSRSMFTTADLPIRHVRPLHL